MSEEKAMANVPVDGTSSSSEVSEKKLSSIPAENSRIPEQLDFWKYTVFLLWCLLFSLKSTVAFPLKKMLYHCPVIYFVPSPLKT